MDHIPAFSQSWDWSSLANDFLEHSFEFDRRQTRKGAQPSGTSTASGNPAIASVPAPSDATSGGASKSR